jgi:SAM-dependent methyltransferase
MTLLEQHNDGFQADHYDVKYFEGHLARYRSVVYSQRVKFVSDFMGDVTTARVLDLGCGVGFFGNMAAERGAKVVGLDFSADALHLCGKHHADLGRVRGDATRLPFGDATFDAVLLNDIIEHLSEEPGRNMIAETFRVLRKGGALIVDTDNDEWLMGRKGFKRLNDRLERGTPQREALTEIKKTYDAPTLHIKIYTVPELRGLLTSVGYRIDRFDTYPYIAVPSRDAVFNLPLIRSLMRDIKGDVQIFRAVKP